MIDTTDVQIRPFQSADLEEVLEVWRKSLPLDAITRSDFLGRVLLDKNFERSGLLVAVWENNVVGFILALCLRHPIENIGLMEHRGFVTAFGVSPEVQGIGVGGALLSAAEDFLRERGRRELAIAPYAPNYFVPGVDREAYARGLDWLKKHGFVEYSEGIAMDALIGKFDLDEELQQRETKLASQGVVVSTLPVEEATDFLDWMIAFMPGDWVEDARGLLQRMVAGDAPTGSIKVARDKGAIVGYCKFDGEHFGPFGVQESHQGSGIGTLLLAKTLLQMRMEGHHAAFVLWTGERAAKGVYGRLGFTISRRFAILRKQLT
ncbi:MAG: GNAT family N-acetyltransferase [Candidatus Sumerlaeia bacterium]|nr:GNAT family N-acetyltransferase [Candidatus Sumerlaeia bacterium]